MYKAGMKKLLLIILFCLPVNSIAKGVEESNFDISRHDHQKHFLISSAISLGASEFYRSQKVEFAQGLGALTAITIGITKELTDSKFSTGDLEADFVGALTGSLLSFSFHF